MSETKPALRLAISDTVVVPMKFSINDNGLVKHHNFSLFAKRLPQDDLADKHKNEGEKPVTDFMTPLVTGWKDQRLVLDANDQPADFTPDALALMFSVTGVGLVAFNSYRTVVMAKEKN